MGWLDKLKRKAGDAAKAITVPIPSERISQEDHINLKSLMSLASSALDIVNPKHPFQFHDILEKLCMANPDFSQALRNIIDLGNTGHEITIAAEDKSSIDAATDRLNNLAAAINTDELVNDLLRQLAVNGALSTEWVPESDLSGIKKVVLVPVNSIRFKYNKEEDTYKPNQYIKSTGKYIELNEITYYYSAIETSDNSPYGIPPFLAAIGSAVIQMFMMDNLKFIIKKLGLLGFISVVLDQESIPMAQGETDEQYRARLTKHLADAAKNFGDNYRDGLVTHFNNIEIQHHNVTGDAQGAKDILQMNEEQIASGLKTDPAMLGRSYSTTETYAGVVYNKMIKQLTGYQRIIKRSIESGYKLDLLMNGIIVDDVSMKFNPSAVLKPLEEAEAEQVRTDTAISKMDAGIISPDDAARELGYDEAYSEGFEPDEGGETFSVTLGFESGRYRVKKQYPSIILLDSKRKRPERDPEGLIERRRQRFIDKYYDGIFAIDRMAINRSLSRIEEHLVGLLDYEPEAFAEEVYGILSDMHPAQLAAFELEKKALKHVLSIYKHYRFRDRLIAGKRIPIKLTMPDKRAINFLNSLDDFHVSKYLKNKPVRKHMLEFLKAEHLEGRTAKVDSFIKKFKGELGTLSKSQVENIVNSSVSRIRSWGHIRQLSETGTSIAVISEVMDSITCPICREMDGKEFRVNAADYKVRELSIMDPDEFVEQVYDNAPSGWKSDPTRYAREHSMADFIANDMVGPPFHARCRGRIVAK